MTFPSLATKLNDWRQAALMPLMVGPSVASWRHWDALRWRCWCCWCWLQIHHLLCQHRRWLIRFWSCWCSGTCWSRGCWWRIPLGMRRSVLTRKFPNGREILARYTYALAGKIYFTPTNRTQQACIWCAMRDSQFDLQLTRRIDVKLQGLSAAS